MFAHYIYNVYINNKYMLYERNKMYIKYTIYEHIIYTSCIYNIHTIYIHV